MRYRKYAQNVFSFWRRSCPRFLARVHLARANASQPQLGSEPALRWLYCFTLVALGMCASPAFAQLDSNSVTVTASRSVNLQPDEIVFIVRVNSGLETTVNDIAAALQGVGIGLGNFLSVSTAQQYGTSFTPTGGTDAKPPQRMLEWIFGLPVALSKMKDTTAMLTKLQQTIAQTNGGLTLSFDAQGTQISQRLQQSSTCAFTDLLSDARAQALKLATASGLNVGTLLAMSSSISTTVSNGVLIGNPYSSYSPACFMSVKFALGRF